MRRRYRLLSWAIFLSVSLQARAGIDFGSAPTDTGKLLNQPEQEVHNWAPDSVTLYSRYVTPKLGLPRLDESLLFEVRPWRVLFTEIGVRLGQSDGAYSYIQYKVELITLRFLRYYRAHFRLSNENDLGTLIQSTNWMGFINYTFPLGETDLHFIGDIGIAQQLQAVTRHVAPQLNGQGPIYGLFRAGFALHDDGRLRGRLFYGNFDVFSPYLPQTPFVQVQMNDRIDMVDVFAYARYRFERWFEFYQMYLALGFIFKF